MRVPLSGSRPGQRCSTGRIHFSHEPRSLNNLLVGLDDGHFAGGAFFWRKLPLYLPLYLPPPPGSNFLIVPRWGAWAGRHNSWDFWDAEPPPPLVPRRSDLLVMGNQITINNQVPVPGQVPRDPPAAPPARSRGRRRTRSRGQQQQPRVRCGPALPFPLQPGACWALASDAGQRQGKAGPSTDVGVAREANWNG